MSNIKQNIDGHNKSILTPKPVKETQVSNCNCRKPIECPIPENCLTESIVYQATVSTSDKQPPETYVGLTENKFKLRYTNHKTSFRSIQKQNCTELSKHIWDLKQRGIEYSILYKISMEIVGALPEPEEILPNTIISLFRILCKNVTESEERHFCLETIEDKEPRTFVTPCCNQKVHCSSFEHWAATAITKTGSTTVRCAYCRTIFPSEQLCFLCLKRKKQRSSGKNPMLQNNNT